MAHREFTPTPFTWLGTYTTGGPNFSPASSPAATDAPTDVMTATDDSAPKRRITAFDSRSKKVKTTSDKKIKNDKYLVLSKFNELYENAEEFQRISYNLLRGLKDEIANATTYNEATAELYEANRILHRSLTKNMTALNDVEVIVQNRKGNT